MPLGDAQDPPVDALALGAAREIDAEINETTSEHPARIAECVRVAREEAKAQTELLRSIDRGQIIRNRTVGQHE